MSVMKFLILNNQCPTREVHACRTTITKIEVKLWEDSSNYFSFFFLMNEITLVLRKKPMLLSTKKGKEKRTITLTEDGNAFSFAVSLEVHSSTRDVTVYIVLKHQKQPTPNIFLTCHKRAYTL